MTRGLAVWSVCWSAVDAKNSAATVAQARLEVHCFNPFLKQTHLAVAGARDPTLEPVKGGSVP